MNEEAMRREAEEQQDYMRLFQLRLLFAGEGARPTAAALREAVRPLWGETDLVADVENLTTLAVKKYPVEYQNGQKVPAQVLMADYVPFDQEEITPLQRTQFWDCPESAALLGQCRYQVMLSDFMAAGLPYKDRCELLTGWLETALDLFTECLAVYVPSAWKLLTPDAVRANPYEGADRFLHFGVNARFFRIQGTEDDMLVDTLGLYAVGLPDVQYHFRGLDPNAVVNHAYSAARYNFDNDAPIRSGEGIDGLRDGRIDQGVEWKCQYEMSMVDPRRELMDVCPGEFAAGERE